MKINIYVYLIHNYSIKYDFNKISHPLISQTFLELYSNEIPNSKF